MCDLRVPCRCIALVFRHVFLPSESCLLQPPNHHRCLRCSVVCVGWPFVHDSIICQGQTYRDDTGMHHHLCCTCGLSTHRSRRYLRHPRIYSDIDSPHIFFICEWYIWRTYEVFLARGRSSRSVEKSFTRWTVLLFVGDNLLSLLKCTNYFFPSSAWRLASVSLWPSWFSRLNQYFLRC